jgi:hypothetical protein
VVRDDLAKRALTALREEESRATVRAAVPATAPVAAMASSSFAADEGLQQSRAVCFLVLRVSTNQSERGTFPT